VKREVDAAAHEQQQQQQLAVGHHHKHHQELDGQGSQPDKSGEFALDNSNVIYDNDGDSINLTQSSVSATTSGGQSNGSNVSAGPSLLKSLVMAASHNSTPTTTTTRPPAQSMSTSSFVHREHADETEEQQDNYATCLLIAANDGSNQANAGGGVAKLAGRLNFWQPIQNRGVTHMIARLRYEYHSSSINSQSADETNNTNIATDGSSSTHDKQRSRQKRESFQALIERPPPVMSMAKPAPTAHTLIHQIRLYDHDCSSLPPLTTNNSASKAGKLVAELKADLVNGTVDMDSELIVGHLNLAEPNPIINKCLRVILTKANGRSDPIDRVRVSQQEANDELDVGHCKIVRSNILPPVSELEQSPNVASNIQALREDLLVSGSSSTSASTITKTAPSNRKALFEMM
jgi:hypothetical protein